MEKKWLIILLIIICVGSFLRIYKLSNQSFWIDEAAAIQKSSKLPSLDNFKSWVIPWMSPPFYNLLLHFWIILFGESEFAVRSLSVIFGILTILVVYFVGADLFNKRTALFSSLILAISPFHIAFSQDVKMYALLSFLGILSVYFFYKTLFSKKKNYWLIYFFVTTLMLYTHNWAIFLFIAENIFFLLVRKHTTNTKKYLLSQLFIVLCYIPWLPILFNQIINSKIHVFLPLSDIYAIWAILAIYCGKVIRIGESLYDVGPFPSVIGISLYGLLFFLGLSIKGQEKVNKYYFWKSREILLLVCSFFLTISIPFLISFKLPMFCTRYTIIVFPLFCLFIGKGITGIRSFKLQALIILILVFIASFTLSKYYYSFVKSYDRELTNYVRQNVEENDFIVIAPNWIGATFEQYYKNYSRDKVEIEKIVNPSRSKAIRLLRKIKNTKKLNKSNKLILLYSYKIPNIELKEFKKYLDNNLWLFSETGFRNKKVIFYKYK